MAFATVEKVVQCVMSISDGADGWQEKFFLPQDTIADALAPAKRVAAARLNALPTTLQMDWVRCMIVGGERDGRSVFDAYPMQGRWTPGSEPEAAAINPNLVTDALKYRIETAEGPWSTRFLRGVPDAEIQASTLVEAIAAATEVPADPLTEVVTGTDWVDQVAVFLLAIKTLTKFMRFRVVDEVRITQTADIAKVIPRGVEYKSTGRRFGQRPGRRSPR